MLKKKKNPQFGLIQNPEFLQFNHICFYKIKLSLFWLLNDLGYLNYISDIAQRVFKSQMISVIEFIEKISIELLCSLLRTASHSLQLLPRVTMAWPLCSCISDFHIILIML